MLLENRAVITAWIVFKQTNKNDSQKKIKKKKERERTLKPHVLTEECDLFAGLGEVAPGQSSPCSVPGASPGGSRDSPSQGSGTPPPWDTFLPTGFSLNNFSQVLHTLKAFSAEFCFDLLLFLSQS